MDLEGFVSNLMAVIGTHSPLVGLSLSVLCFISEVTAIGIPFAFEAALILAGYNVSIGNYNYSDIIIIITMTLAGRLLGTFILYSLASRGKKLVEKTRPFFFLKLKMDNNASLQRMVDKVDRLSPFSVAAGRFLWLSYPLTLVMAAHGKLKVLMLGALLNGFIYDGIYILAGVVMGANTKLEPFQVILCCIAALTVVYIVFYIIQRLR